MKIELNGSKLLGRRLGANGQSQAAGAKIGGVKPLPASTDTDGR